MFVIFYYMFFFCSVCFLVRLCSKKKRKKNQAQALQSAGEKNFIAIIQPCVSLSYIWFSLAWEGEREHQNIILKKVSKPFIIMRSKNRKKALVIYMYDDILYLVFFWYIFLAIVDGWWRLYKIREDLAGTCQWYNNSLSTM